MSDDEPAWREEDDPVLRHPRIAAVRCTGQAAPEQHEGTLADGRVFYFRVRFSRVTLGVGATLDDAVQDGWTRRAVTYEPPLAKSELEGLAARVPGLSSAGRTGLMGWFDTDDDRQRIFAELLEAIE